MGYAVDILLVEDNPGDQRLTMEGLARTKLKQTSHVVADGEAALRYLRAEGEFKGATHPDFIILDLNLPRRDGREVLAEIKQDPKLRKIPVVVLTTSESPDDVKNAYDLGANCYLTKPSEFQEYLNLMKGVQEFWFSLATLPGRYPTAVV